MSAGRIPARPLSAAGNLRVGPHATDHAALTQAGRTVTGRIRGQHLTILLDAAREDLGAPGSPPAQRLPDVPIRAVLSCTTQAYR
ncbi:hypothetical protein [Streptomyces achromogenes]|uniref:hypothetical protein n=1 Tax=Streptomyces achromogenes TaxID=67255 RepID=UPI0004CC4B9C|nr:hypothetical protein [Streptomyces achromogenes]